MTTEKLTWTAGRIYMHYVDGKVKKSKIIIKHTKKWKFNFEIKVL
jgi:hypothetical protein